MSSTLAQLIDSGEVTPRVVALMQQPAVEAIMRARDDDNGKTGVIDTSSFNFDDDLKYISVTPHGDTASSEADDVMAYGHALLATLDATPVKKPRVAAIATACVNGEYTLLGKVYLQLERHAGNTIYIPLIVVIIALLLLLYVLNNVVFK
jgi:hypothetical protein